MSNNDDVIGSCELARADQGTACLDPSFLGACFVSAHDVSKVPEDATYSAEIAHSVRALRHLASTRQSLTRITAKQLRQELRRGWRAVLNLSIEEAFEIATTIESALADLPQPDFDPFMREIKVLRAVGFALTDHDTSALALAVRAQPNQLGPRLRRLVSTVGRFCHWKGGNVTKLYRSHQHHAANRVTRRVDLLDVFDLSIEAAAELQNLRLSTARRLAGDALEMAQASLTDSSIASPLPATLLGQIAYEEGDLDRAERFLRRTLQPPLNRSPIECLARAYPVCARIAVHRGQYNHALQMLTEGERVGDAKGSARLIAICISEQVGIHIESGNLELARMCLERLTAISHHQQRNVCGRRSRIEMHGALAAARLALAATPSRAQVAVVRQLHQDALEWNDFYASVGLALRLVEALVIIGEADDAASILARTIRLAANSGIFQSFIDGGPHVCALLVRMNQEPDSKHLDLTPFLSSVVRRLTTRPVQRDLSHSTPSAKKALTRREYVVMQLIGDGLSNKHIARELHIAPETVKSHAKHIFVKLNFQTRAQAVAYAAGQRLI